VIASGTGWRDETPDRHPYLVVESSGAQTAFETSCANAAQAGERNLGLSHQLLRDPRALPERPAGPEPDASGWIAAALAHRDPTDHFSGGDRPNLRPYISHRRREPLGRKRLFRACKRVTGPFFPGPLQQPPLPKTIHLPPRSPAGQRQSDHEIAVRGLTRGIFPFVFSLTREAPS
jgi:hypothetical protein